MIGGTSTLCFRHREPQNIIHWTKRNCLNEDSSVGRKGRDGAVFPIFKHSWKMLEPKDDQGVHVSLHCTFNLKCADRCHLLSIMLTTLAYIYSMSVHASNDNQLHAWLSKTHYRSQTAILQQGHDIWCNCVQVVAKMRPRMLL